MVEFLSSYTVSYNSESHWSVLTQCWGSMWPKVLPYCILNVALMLLLSYIDAHSEKSYIIEISTQGHTFITLVVAFLLVSRVNMGLARFNMARDYLGTMYKEVRELIQCAVVFTNHDINACEWRHELAYRTLLLLRTSMVVIDYPVDTIAPWEIPELNGKEKDDIVKHTYLNSSTRRWAHGERTTWEECMRVPIRVAFLLRKTIHEQSKRVKDMQLIHEMKLLASVDSFMSGYYGMRKFLTTPVPFPLIQMARTFLFLYVFTVPFVMIRDDSGIVAHCFTVFLLTYGFVGLEIVAMELDNPFGDDANDFNNSALAMTAYEDTYLTILDVDGVEWTDKLRARMHDKNQDISQSLRTEQSWLLTSVV